MLSSLLYRRIEVTGMESLPSRGPVVALLLDSRALFVRKQLSRRFDSLWWVENNRKDGKSSIYAQGFARRKLPLHRYSETDLTSAFKANLEAGAAIALVVRHPETLEFIVKLLLSVETENKLKLGIRCLVVATQLAEVAELRPDLWLQIREVADFKQWAEKSTTEPKEATMGLAHQVNKLQRSMLHKSLPIRKELMVEQLKRLYTLDLNQERRPTAEAHSDIAVLLERLSSSHRHETVWRQIQPKVRRLSYCLETLGIRERSLEAQQRPDTVFRNIRKKLALNALLIPAALWGMINHYLIYKLPYWIEFWRGKPISQPTMLQIVSLPIFYLLQVWFVGTVYNWTAALIYLISLPLSILPALLLVENRAVIWDNWQLLKLLKTDQPIRKQLLQWRWEILDTLTSLDSQGDHDRDTANL